MSKKLKKEGQFYDRAGNLCTYRENGTLRVQTLNELPSRTIQSEKDSCDINKILAKFKATGIMTNINTRQPLDGDFTEVADYHSAMIQVAAAQESFMALPSALRKRFGNDPGNLLNFLSDPQNLSEAVSLGLVNAPPADKVPQGDVPPPDANGG